MTLLIRKEVNGFYRLMHVVILLSSYRVYSKHTVTSYGAGYRERLTHPKLVISATGDEFFLLSDSHYWWDDMPGNNWFMYVTSR